MWSITVCLLDGWNININLIHLIESRLIVMSFINILFIQKINIERRLHLSDNKLLKKVLGNYLVANTVERSVLGGYSDDCMGSPLPRRPVHLPDVESFTQADLTSDAIGALCYGVPVKSQLIIILKCKRNNN